MLLCITQFFTNTFLLYLNFFDDNVIINNSIELRNNHNQKLYASIISNEHVLKINYLQYYY